MSKGNGYNNWLVVEKDGAIIEIRGNKDNAHLMLAAPDLYDALSAIFAEVQYYEPDWYGVNLHKKIITALAKAEGRGEIE